MKKLYRNRDNKNGSKVVSGIFGGLGEWMEVSPNILRVGAVLLALIGGIIPAILIYFMFHFMLPKKF